MNPNYFSREFVEKLSFPRLVGSEGEQAAQKSIEEELNTLQINTYEKQPFYYCLFRNNLLRCYDVIIGILMLSIFLLFISYIVEPIFILSSLLFLLSFKGRTIKETLSFDRNNKTEDKYCW